MVYVKTGNEDFFFLFLTLGNPPKINLKEINFHLTFQPN